MRPAGTGKPAGGLEIAVAQIKKNIPQRFVEMQLPSPETRRGMWNHRGAMRSSVSVSVRGLVKRYGKVTAVDGLDLAVRERECFGLLGPNGAGKTTTIEVIVGLLRPSSGEVLVLGRRWGKDDGELRSRIGVALQETRFSDRLTVREVVALFRSFYPKGRDPRDVIREVGLEEPARDARGCPRVLDGEAPAG